MSTHSRPLVFKLGALFLVLCCSTLPVLHKFRNGLVYDDSAVIHGPLIHQPARLPEVFATHAMLAQGSSEIQALDTYRPIAIASFFWDAWLSGKELWSYHLTNLALHLGCVACLFILCLELVPQASLFSVSFATLFFGLSPQLAEAHVWINGRSDPMATLFGLSAMLSWRAAQRAHGSRRGVLLHLAAGTLFLLGLLSKEVLLMVTPALLFWPESRATSLRERIRNCASFIAASTLYLTLRVWALQGMKASASPTHLREALTNLPVLWIDGLVELLAPSRLYLRSMHAEYAHLSAGQGLALATLVALLGLGAARIRNRTPVLTWSLGWFALCIAPAAMISTLNWPGFGRYLYLPCAGLALGICESIMIVDGVASRASSPRLAPLLRVALAGYLTSHAFSLATVTSDYRNNLTLFGAVVRANPSSAYGHGWLGVSLRDDGHPAEAIPWLERALNLGGFEPRYARSLIRAHLALGQYELAEDLARDAVSRSHHDPHVGSEMRAQLIRALAPRSPVQAMAVLCECLDFAPQARPCLSAMDWMIGPASPNLAAFNQQFRLFASRCRSDRARRAFQQRVDGVDRK